MAENVYNGEICGEKRKKAFHIIAEERREANILCEGYNYIYDENSNFRERANPRFINISFIFQISLLKSFKQSTNAAEYTK